MGLLLTIKSYFSERTYPRLLQCTMKGIYQIMKDKEYPSNISNNER